ncbi:signal transducing adapter molecule 2-like isoform X1 [Styela clava]
MGIFSASTTIFDQQLDKATDECNTEEDWGLIMTICDKVKTTTDGSKEFCKAILKKITHKVPHVALQALTIMDSAVNNCGIEFKKEIASQEFISKMRDIMANPPHPKVGAHLKMLIRQWAEDFKDDPQLSRLTSFYHFMRSEGTEFPTPEELNPKKKAAPVSKDPNVVSSQQEADDIAKAIEMSLKEDNQKKNLSSSLTMTSSSTAASSSLYPTMLGGSSSTSTQQSTSYTSGHMSGVSKKTVKAIYDFEAAEDNELTFKAGDLISILDDSDANWWKGEGANGQGLFPANFVTSDLTVEPEPEFGVGKADEEEEERTVSFNEEVEVKEVDLSEPVLEIDESLMDKTLVDLQNTDPESGIQDTNELLQNEDSCTQMGPLIDQKLEEIDRKHLEYTQLNEKILEALNMYDKLMNEMPAYNPIHAAYMKNPAAAMSTMNPYGQQMVSAQQVPSFPPQVNPAMYGQPQHHMRQAETAPSSSNPQLAGAANYQMYQQAPPAQAAPTTTSYAAHNGMTPQGISHSIHAPNNQPSPQGNFPQQVYRDTAVSSTMHTNQMSYSNQTTLPQHHQQQYNMTTSYSSQPNHGQQYSTTAVPSMQPMM